MKSNNRYDDVKCPKITIVNKPEWLTACKFPCFLYMTSIGNLIGNSFNYPLFQVKYSK